MATPVLLHVSHIGGSHLDILHSHRGRASLLREMFSAIRPVLGHCWHAIGGMQEVAAYWDMLTLVESMSSRYEGSPR